MLGADGFKTTFVFFFLLSFLSFFIFHFFSLLPTLFPLGRGPFASLARGQPSPFAFVILANAGIHAWFSFYAFPCHSVANTSSFTFCLLMWACLKTERLRWGSPTATAPFAPLDFGLCAFVTRSLSLSKGRPSPRAFVILANAGITGK